MTKKKQTSAKTTKRRVTKKTKPMINADPYECFWVCNGEILKNLKELSNTLNKMSENVFKYHVTKEKNDFAEWVEKVFGDKTLARELKRLKTAKSSATKIKGNIK